MDYNNQKEIAQNLLLPLWRCVDAEFKKSSGKEVWRYFEQFVRTAATSPTLSRFFGAFKRLCPFEWSTYHSEGLVAYMQSCDESQVLKMLRGDDLALIIIFTREAAKASYEEHLKTKEENK